MLRFWTIVVAIIPLLMLTIVLHNIWKEKFTGKTVVFVIVGIAMWLAIASFTGLGLLSPIILIFAAIWG